MRMEPAERIPLLRKLARALSDTSTMEWSEMELILRQFGFSMRWVWSEESPPTAFVYALYQLEHGGDDDKLLALERYLDPAAESPHASGAGDARVPALDVQGPWNGEDAFVRPSSSR